jgi:hypothetical protein
MARLAPNQPIKPGVFTIWVIARNAAEAAALERMAKTETSWNVLTISNGYNLMNGLKKTGLKLVFPPSRKVGTVWVPRKGFDKTPPKDLNASFGAMYFLVEFQKAA